MSRVLLTSWCSFDEVVGTVGDERAVEVVSGWPTTAGIDHDVAWAGYLGRRRALADCDPAAYTDLVFACGPLLDAPPLQALLRRFAACRRTAVGVSVVDAGVADRFGTVLARDGDTRDARPDLACAPGDLAPAVVAVVLAPHQPEYGGRARHAEVRSTIAAWLADRGHGWFEVETDVWTHDRTARRSAQTVAALARADVVVSTRLHGLVLGLVAGRPVLAVDPVAGGAKVAAQAQALGWPVLLHANEVDVDALDTAFERCRHLPTPGGAATATGLEAWRTDLLEAVVRPPRAGYRP